MFDEQKNETCHLVDGPEGIYAFSAVFKIKDLLLIVRETREEQTGDPSFDLNGRIYSWYSATAW